jgi:protein involved in polysaccharide export with SLBB domain
VADSAQPAISPAQLLAGLNLLPERNTDLIRLEFKTAASAYFATEILNRYARGVVDLTRKLQAEEANTVRKFLEQQIERTDKELESLSAEMLAYGRDAKLLNADKEFDAYLRKQSDLDLKYESTRIEFETIGLRIASTEQELGKNSPGANKLQTAKDELTGLLAKFTESNPLVLEQRSKIAALEKQAAEHVGGASSFPASGESGVADSLFLELVQLRATQKTLAEQVKQLDVVRRSVAEQLNALPAKQMHYAKIQARKTSMESSRELLENRLREATLFSENALGYYRVLSPATENDVATFPRSKKVALFAVLGFFAGAALIAFWSIRRIAFDGFVRTTFDLRRASGLEILMSLPIEITTRSARENWAFRTWTTLRSRLGIGDSGGVVGFLSREAEVVSAWLELLGNAASQRGQRVIIASGKSTGMISLTEALENSSAVLELIDARSPLVISVDDDVAWNASLRTKWHSATQAWIRETGAIVFLEIPAAGEPESVLLSEKLPEIVVLASSGMNRESEISDLVAPYREAGCNLSGVALDASPALRPAWIAAKLQTMLGVLIAMFIVAQSAHAAPVAPKKPAWLQSYKLGPGDGFNITVYGHTELTRNDVFVAADGRLNFLQANIVAAGLTVDELRAKLNAELGRYYQHVRVIVSPIAYASKRIFVLGKVVNKGQVMLDRPLTILEAVAEAGGLETGLYQLNTVELADLPRSLLVRNGKRVPCDFEKLFNEGDMEQNHILAPDDYLFFPSSNTNEFHVFGSVQNPGTQALTPQATVVSSISIAGSFTRKAWQKRVLVIRGSLSKPETFVVNVDEVLAGRERDFRLEPRDIVFVADRPWARVEELLETAVSAFTQAAVASWTGANIGPLISRPILPQR